LSVSNISKVSETLFLIYGYFMPGIAVA